MGVGHVVEKEQKLIGTRRKVIIFLKSRVGVLSCIRGSRLHGSVSSHAIPVGIVVRSPSVILISVHIDAVMNLWPAHKPDCQRTGVIFIDLSGGTQKRRHPVFLFCRQTEALANPFPGNLLR